MATTSTTTMSRYNDNRENDDIMLTTLPSPTPTIPPSPHPEEEAAETNPPPPTQYPTGLPLALLFLAACLSLLLTELDIQIIATAIPSITNTFRTSADIGWYSSSYRLALCSLQFLFGRLYRTWQLKRVFLGSLLVFEMGSAICGAAPSSSVFILGRVVSGLGASGVFAGCWQILTVSFPLRYRPIAYGLAAGVEGISSVAGPVIGGVLTTYANWRWCFYINLPIGGVVLVLLAVFLQNPPMRPPNADLPWREKIMQTDPLGTAIFVPAVCCLFVGMQYGAVEYGWADKRVIVLFVVSAVLLPAFAWVQWKRQDKATLPPRIIKRRSVLAGFLFSLCVNSALNVVTYYLPTYLQVVKDLSAAKAGLWMMPLLGGFILSLMCAGPLISAVGVYVPFMLAASVLMPIASGLLTTLRVNGPSSQLIVYEVLFGLSAGIGFPGPQVAVQTTLSDADVSMGQNIIVFAQNFGPALFITVAQSLFNSRLVSNLAEKVPGIGLNGTALSTLGVSEIKKLVPAGELSEMLLAYDDAISQMLYLVVGLTCVTMVGSLTMEWRSVKEKRS